MQDRQGVSIAERFLRVTLLLNGLLLFVTGVILAVNPAWFYTLAPFAPFNRHFMGDAGIFSAGLGAVLLWTARAPLNHQPFVLIGSLAAVWHGLNHAYDHIQEGGLAHALREVVFWRDGGLLLLGLMSLVALAWARSSQD